MNKIFYFILLFIILLLSNDLFGYKENNTNITFIHIPKNAGTTIEHTGYKNGYIWGKYSFYNYSIIFYLDEIMSKCKFDYRVIPRFIKNLIFNICNNKLTHHIPKYIKNNINTKKNKISFMVVRNPYTKIISCFKFLKNEKDINVFVKKHINMYKNKNKFVDYVLFIPQHEYLLNNTEVLKFENLQEDFYNFCKKHNLKKMTLQKINVSSNKYNVDIKKLNNESITLINEIYSKDFELFGYKKINPN